VDGYRSHCTHYRYQHYVGYGYPYPGYGYYPTTALLSSLLRLHLSILLVSAGVRGHAARGDHCAAAAAGAPQDAVR